MLVTIILACVQQNFRVALELKFSGRRCQSLSTCGGRRQGLEFSLVHCSVAATLSCIWQERQVEQKSNKFVQGLSKVK